MTTDTPAVPSTSDEDVYQRAARAWTAKDQWSDGSATFARRMAAMPAFRAAVDAALDAAYPDPDAVLVELVAVDADLAAARAEIAAQAATITELRARISRFDVGNPYGWTPDEIARREQASAELDKLVDRDD